LGARLATEKRDKKARTDMKLTQEQHARRHQELHAALDELLADWITQTGGYPSKVSLMEFLGWSAAQARKPDHEQEGVE
jgi:hypothetical protein